jgi:hypothetical protein
MIRAKYLSQGDGSTIAELTGPMTELMTTISSSVWLHAGEGDLSTQQFRHSAGR